MYYQEEWKKHYEDLSKQALLKQAPKGVSIRTPQRGMLEVEVRCFRLLPFIVALVPVLFSGYTLYVGVMVLYTEGAWTAKLFGLAFLILTAWIWYKKPIKVLAYGFGKVRLQFTNNGLKAPLFIGERMIQEEIALDWSNLEKVTIENSKSSRADNEREIRLYGKDNNTQFLYDYYTQKQLAYVAAWIREYQLAYENRTEEDGSLDLIDFSEHLLEE